MPPSTLLAVDPRRWGESMPGAILAVVAATAVGYLLARLVGRFAEVVLLTILGRGRAREQLAGMIATPVRMIRRGAFVLFAILLSFPAVELTGHRAPVGLSPTELTRWLTGPGARIGIIIALSWGLVRLVHSVIAQMERDVAAASLADGVERSRRIRTLGSL